MLQYDDSAFYFFALASISFYVIPSWYYILKKVYNAFIGLSDQDIGAVTRTTLEEKKAIQLKKNSKGLSTLKSQGFIFNLILTIVFTIIFVYLLFSVTTDGEVNSFDPFHILEIDAGSSDKIIKKAYRKLSLEFHPDKNPNNPVAEAKFMMIAKAYEALTDPVAKENFEKYGNPDGKQSLAVSIGLPLFLLNPDNRNLVLMTYLIIMVIVIPFCVYTYYSDSSKYGEKDVMYDTYSWYHHTLNEHSTIKSIPEIFAGSAEFRKRNMPKTQKDKQDIGTIMTSCRAQMQKPKYNHPVCVKGNVLMHSHLLRKEDSLGEELKMDLNYMLSKSNSLIDAMISVCQQQDLLQTAMNCIEFGQYVAQACWVRDSNLLQLPHFTPEEIKHITTKGKKTLKDEDGNVIDPTTITGYRQVPNEDKKGLADFTDSQKLDIYECLDHVIPNIDVTSKVFTDDDDDDAVYEGDLVTIKVIIERNNIKAEDSSSKKPILVHAPYFPFPKMESWWIILGTRDGKILHIEKVSKSDKVIEHDIKFLAPRVGEYDFDLFVKSNAYMGLDSTSKVKLVTLDNSSLPEYKVHPDDAELDDEPTLFEEMLNTNLEQDSDSDDDDDDDSDGEEEEVDNKKPAIRELTDAERKKAALRNADDDSDDDDDEVEEVYTEK